MLGTLSSVTTYLSRFAETTLAEDIADLPDRFAGACGGGGAIFNNPALNLYRL